MILPEKQLRTMIASFLSEDLAFNGPYNDDFNVAGIDTNQKVIDLSKLQTASVYKISRVVEALTNKDRGNIAAWKYVAEQMLSNKGFMSINKSRKKSAVFGDTKKDGCLYSVKSSFQGKESSANPWIRSISSAGLDASTLFDLNGNFKKEEIFGQHGCDSAGMIFCFRKDHAQTQGASDLFGQSFSIVWYVSPKISLDAFEQKIQLTMPNKGKTYSGETIRSIFGEPVSYWQIIFPDYSKGASDYNKKIELYNMVDTLPEDKYDMLAAYINDLLAGIE